MGTPFSDSPHRRLNYLSREWVLVSPHSMKQPWQGQVEKLPADNRPASDPTCYLCPGNERASGAKNPQYLSTFVFTNDFAAILPDSSPAENATHPLLQVRSVTGTSQVICFSQRHDLTLPQMEPSDIRRVVDIWAKQLFELGRTYRWVQIFENKGSVIGCSNPHPHGQIWANDSLPNEPAKEDEQQRRYYEKYALPLLIDYADLEWEQKKRIVVSNDHWLAVVSYWAVRPFEILLLPRRAVLPLPDLNRAERDALADILKKLLTKYDNLFETSFPYSMDWHGAPFEVNSPGESFERQMGRSQYSPMEAYAHWQLHAHFYPLLLRSATVKKILVGHEMLAEVQRDLTAEQAEQSLRILSEIQYFNLIDEEEPA